MDMVVVAGKSRKNVSAYILLTQDAKDAIDALLATRETVGVPQNNPYVFARLNASTPLSGTQDLKEMVFACKNIAYPERITSNLLRKYIATVSQVMDMKGQELQMLATHLGHDVKTHKEYYRLSSQTLELSKVSRLLCAVENGLVNRWTGKQLSDIDLEELPKPEPDESADEDIQTETEEKSTIEEIESFQQNDHEVDQQDLKPQHQSRTVEFKGVRTGPKRRWTPKEHELLLSHFGKYIKGCKLPPAEKLLAAADSSFSDRTVAQIRTKLHNIITNKDKQFHTLQNLHK